MHYMSSKFGIDSSSRFYFREWKFMHTEVIYKSRIQLITVHSK